MPVIRFVREGRDVPCLPGENLREVALRAGVELYGWKGRLGNCGGCGQCITCFIAVDESTQVEALSPRTPVEDLKLRRRPPQWRLACQALVNRSLIVLTRPQADLPNRESLLEAARRAPLPDGPELPEGLVTAPDAGELESEPETTAESSAPDADD
ncbi:(2Fe-2S)-binding protein [Synechococcus sp. RSCCF101]|uniref:2Fe-2S iron-sulfur cluster-binding protein n=1 Tax=Synechococcus sp. RSCCF101 TaxID=2511069 RepID=UPI001246F40C|nr:2Fe-2S iron-sulfur cluster-binding protein [Synechococcus sp. RSCCF101]QEY32116.1 (2Fe-2S)-binding protein [Synechococcus sp. RSCCF101]